MAAPDTINPSVFEEWVKGNIDPEEIKRQLIDHGYDDASVEIHLSEIKKKKQARRQSSGFLFIAAGSVIGFIGCVVAMVNPVPEMYSWFLYGIGSASVLVILSGLYQVFE